MTANRSVGICTEHVGRYSISPALRARGFAVRVAHVYRRVPPRWSQAELDALASSAAPRAFLLTSGEALANTLAGLPPPLRAIVLDATAVASSERLAAQARDAGFAATLVAASPLLESLLATLAAHAKAGAIR